MKTATSAWALYLVLCLSCGGEDPDAAAGSDPGSEDTPAAGSRTGSDAGIETVGGSTEMLTCALELCAGDPSGTWLLDRLCGAAPTVENPDPSCPGAIYETAPVASGRLVLNDDRRYTRNLTFGVEVRISYPLSCFADCDDLEGGLDKENPGIQCIEDSGACVCTNSMLEELDVRGSYEITGSRVLLTDSDSAEATAFDFCVGNNTLLFDTVGGEPFSGILFLRQ